MYSMEKVWKITDRLFYTILTKDDVHVSRAPDVRTKPGRADVHIEPSRTTVQSWAA